MNLISVKYFILLLTSVLIGTITSSLDARTTYTTSILSFKEDQTALFKAIKDKNLKQIKSLINSGSDVNEKDDSGYTPLMTAISLGNLKIVKLLISKGAELEDYDNFGNTPLMYALYDSEEKDSILEFLLSLNVNTELMNKDELTPLILATLNNHCKSMKLLIDSGVNIETKGKSGRTALMSATDNNNIEPARLLIKSGANLETRDDWSLTPLMWAAFKNDGAMIKVLLEAGADINASLLKTVPIALKKDWTDFFPKTVYIPKGSTALDIAKLFQQRFAESALTKK